MEKLIKKIKINTTITLLSGLHIGGSSENIEIGGIDTPVIKLSFKNGQPYIPGSSLKGKIRCLLEQTEGANEIGLSPKVNHLFGITESRSLNITQNIPSRVIVRDAMLTKDSEIALRGNDNLDMPYTEAKTENTLDRITAKSNPRTIERVPAGAVFNAEFIINVWDDDKEDDLMAFFERGIRLLENDYLGGNGSRGYGQIKFGELKKTEISETNNWKA